MSLDKLKRYRVDSAYTQGVVITLDEAPDVEFLVRLPGKHNRAYIAEMYGAVEFSLDGEVPNVTRTFSEMQDLQERAFLKHCLLSIDGEPVPPDFAAEYPDALEELMAKANKMAQAHQEGADAAKKKSVTTFDGSVAGVAG
jgi:hypothetical protein